MRLSPIELSLLDDWQRNFPIVGRPFEIVGQSVGINEHAALQAYERLRERQVLSRIGAVVRPHTMGTSTLAAMRVPAARLDDIAAIVSREPLVTHNYERVHDYNLWFVVAGPDANAIKATLRSISQQSGLAVLDLPMLRAYHLDLGFSLQGRSDERGRGNGTASDFQPDAADQQLLAAIEDGLPMVARPYRDVAARVRTDETDVIERLRRLLSVGIVTRFGCVVHHRTLGYSANAMAVWDVPVEKADDVAAALIQHPLVTLCYRRSRHLPDWPYNLYCMVHAKSQPEALGVIDKLDANAGLTDHAKAILFSRRCFKQRGAVFSAQARKVH
jgi:DNA-binding Lrp family transcriptional regulator